MTCNKPIAHRELILNCVICSEIHHCACLKMTSTYYKNKKQDLQKSWRCPSCENITNRRNRDTPIGKQTGQLNFNKQMSIDDKRADDSNSITNQESITLDKFSQILNTTLDKKLEEHKQITIREITHTLQNTIKIEVQNAIQKLKEDMIQSTKILQDKQTDITKNINSLTTTIQKLEADNENLKEEIKQIQNIVNKQHNSPQPKEDHARKIVMYGLREYSEENEYHLHQRILNVFHNIVHVDLTGYIEDQIRIGKKGYQRPIVIEILSKNMTNYLLENAHCFKNTGLAISRYLNDEALELRKRLQEQARHARQNGRHAIIRNNRLFIDGKLTVSYHEHHVGMGTAQPPSQISQPHQRPSSTNTTQDSSAATEHFSTISETHCTSATINHSQHNFRHSTNTQ